MGAIGGSGLGGSDGRRRVGYNRWIAGGASLLLGVVGVVGTRRGLAAHDLGSAAMCLIIFTPFTVFYARRTLRVAPVLVFDREGLEDLRSGHAVRWGDLEEAYVSRRQGRFDEYHYLVLVPRPAAHPGKTSTNGTMRLSLDQLSIKWDGIVPLIEAESGRAIPIQRER